MLLPLQQWYCDSCDGVIERPELGYITWNWDDEGRAFDFKVIHKSRCDRGDDPASIDVESLLGQDGLSYLLSYLSIGPIKQRLGQKRNEVADLNEFVDLMRRLQLPHYEEARRRFADEEVLDLLFDSNEVAPYMQDILHRLAAGEPLTS